MPYITSIERVDYRRGLRKGIEAMLRARFGDDGLKLMPEITTVYDEAQLERILNVLETAAGPDDVRRIWSPSAS